MKIHPVFLALLLLAAGAADAQLYKWVDKDGRVRYGDTPPPGAAASSIKAPAPSAAPAASAPDAKGAKGPLTEAEKEQAFRKRQADAAKAAEKADSEARAKQEKADNCARMAENLRSLESGQRIMRVNAAGERYYLDESQMAQEAANVRRSMQQVCN